MKYYDSRMKNAFLLLVGLVLILFCVQMLDADKFTELNLAVGLVGEILWAGVLVFCIKIVKEYKLESVEITVWGFFWRSVVTKYLSFVLSMVIYFLAPIDFDLPSTEYTIFIYILAVSSSLLVSWALFSVSRMAQFRWAFGAVRGY